MIYNDAPLSFEVTSRTKTNLKTGIQFSTQDIETARLIFTITKDGVPLPLSAVSGKLVMCMADGSRFIRNVEIIDAVGGVAQYVLTADEIKHYGAVNAELNLYYANNQALSVHKFTFSIDRALVDVDIVPIAEYYIDDFEALREKINELYDEAISTIEELRKKFEDLENIETKAGAQAKADAAEENAKNASLPRSGGVSTGDITIKKASPKLGFQKDDVTEIGAVRVNDSGNFIASGTASPMYFRPLGDMQSRGQLLVTETYISHNGNTLENVVGSQNKADKALADAKTYTDNQLSVAQLFKLTQDNGAAKYCSGVDFNSVTETGFYYMSGATIELNAPVKNNGYLIVNNYGTYAYQEYTTYSSSDSSSSGRRKFMRNKVSSSDSWTSWREFESTEGSQAKADKALNDAKAYTDTKVLMTAWVNIPLINGAVTDAAAPLRYRLKNGGDEIQLNGGFKSSFSTIIATGLPKIKNPIEFLVATVGTYGFLRMDYRTNGDLYLAGGTVNSEAGISKISVNVTIPVS
ncbi:BppU family phage baseplate upper protein [Bacillus spizizenii]|nr:BppU family phage baseplate upper protein [Bacillus spizizenii]